MNFNNWLQSQPKPRKVDADFGGFQIKNPVIRALLERQPPFPVNKEQEAVQRPDKPFVASETGNFGVDMGDK